MHKLPMIKGVKSKGITPIRTNLKERLEFSTKLGKNKQKKLYLEPIKLS